MNARSRLPDLLFLVTATALALWFVLPRTVPPVPPEKLLLGTWEMWDKDERIRVTFREGQILEVQEDDDGRVERARYQVDFSVTPAHFDLWPEGDRDSIQTILELTPEGKLRISDNNPGSPRPTAFKQKAYLFTRVE
ncbi:MAG: hypothetical protein AMXMBFR33_50380 [Candidatus Xenobia bacterium]|jgi:hypothetical protein